MEHLFFEPDENDPRPGLTYNNDVLSTKFAYNNDVLFMDWTTISDPIDFIPPETPWLDFAHDEAPQAQELQGYAVSLGWNIDQIWNGHIGKAHHDLNSLDPVSVGKRVASFLQSWLYFGLLETILGKKVKVSYLMRRNSNGRNTLYTQNLHFCLQAKVFHIRIKERDRKLAVQQDMGKNLLLARDWLFRLTAFGFGRFKENLDRDFPGFMDLVSDTTPAVVRLVEAIRETMLYVFEDWPMQGLANLHVPLAAVELRRTRLRQVGWCEYQIKLLEATTNQSTVDWLVNTDIRQDPLGHEDCTEMACARNNVDVSTYKQRHCVPNCPCAPLFPDLNQIEQILRRDQLPVICVEYPNLEPQLTVQAMDKGKAGDYVAISHVWVDGLGGSTEKGLLTCQVLRVHSLVTKVLGTRPGAPARFWIDSLCIPPHSSDMFMAALIGIRDVYSCASLVLVIDRLVQQCSPSASIEVLFASIYMSAWMQRMWTYEEAVLARRLIFLLSNDEFHEYNSKTTGPTMRQTVSVVWRTLATQLSRLRKHEIDFNIGHVYLAFRFRLTNATGDEFLSVASMLGFGTNDLDALEKVKGEERVRDFWLNLKYIPANIVSTEGPKLSFPGFRWAPKTMMYPTETRLDTMSDSRKCVCTKDGLFGSFLYLQLDRRLQGCNVYPHKRLLDRVMEGDDRLRNQNFIIWVEGDRSTGRMEDKGTAYRLYCDEAWPAPPKTALFDSVVISTTDSVTPDPGQMWPAVFLLRDEFPGTSQATGTGASTVCKYIGRGVVERLRMEEFAHATPTIMYTGSDYTVIEARGELRVSNLCVT
ncbi:Nn.00g080410.m01.CDS01 [Neocucurbitaria sp. VM-36]